MKSIKAGVPYLYSIIKDPILKKKGGEGKIIGESIIKR